MTWDGNKGLRPGNYNLQLYNVTISFIVYKGISNIVARGYTVKPAFAV